LAVADRLRIVQGGGDELVEIDILEVESLEHMVAARAQKLRHLRLVGVTVELRLHRLRRNRHLAQRKPGRKNLDQNRFHHARVERCTSRPLVNISGRRGSFDRGGYWWRAREFTVRSVPRPNRSEE